MRKEPQEISARSYRARRLTLEARSLDRARAAHTTPLTRGYVSPLVARVRLACPVEHRPIELLNAPTRVLRGISGVDSPTPMLGVRMPSLTQLTWKYTYLSERSTTDRCTTKNKRGLLSSYYTTTYYPVPGM